MKLLLPAILLFAIQAIAQTKSYPALEVTTQPLKQGQTIDHLIQKRSTGNSALPAEKIEVYKRSAKEFIAGMKGLGVDEK